MSKKHIIRLGHRYYAVDSVTAATQAIALLSKLKPVRLNHDADRTADWFYEPDEDRSERIELELNQSYREARKPKAEKPLALPAPKRGSILCICEKSYVAPKQHCPHCGRPFSESHNRTHASTAKQSNLRLI